MNKQTTRAFAFGLLASALALLIYSEAAGSASLSSEKAMIQNLEKKQYVVWSAKEAAQQKQEKEQLEQELSRLTTGSNKKKETTQQTEKEGTNGKKPYILRIESGMSSSEVGQALEKAGIVDDSEKFNDYLTENGYAEKLQVGEHTVHPSMSMKEIAVVLTTK